jgi:DDE superfamily endonuclease
MESNGSRSLITLDGTDFRIQEPAPFDRKWYSHKHHGPGVRYEVGVCIQTGWVVWVNGPFPCGSFSDIKIARVGIQHKLDPGEMYVADGGYRDGRRFGDTPTGFNDDDQRMKGVARARHEVINSRLKQWGALRQVYRHNLTDHGKVFLAVANVTQLTIESLGPPFEVRYDDRTSV